MGKGPAAAGSLTPLRPVTELVDHLSEVTGVAVDRALVDPCPLRRLPRIRADSLASPAGGQQQPDA